MAGEAALVGLAKHFNSVTLYGRANVAKVTFILTVGAYSVPVLAYHFLFSIAM